MKASMRVIVEIDAECQQCRRPSPRRTTAPVLENGQIGQPTDPPPAVCPQCQQASHLAVQAAIGKIMALERRAAGDLGKAATAEELESARAALAGEIAAAGKAVADLPPKAWAIVGVHLERAQLDVSLSAANRRRRLRAAEPTSPRQPPAA
jgi:hypothetical protein